MFLHKFYNAEEGAGGGADVIEPPVVTDDPIVDAAPAPDTVPSFVQELSKYGFKDVSEFEAFVANKKEPQKTEVEKQREVDIENANFRAFAIKEGQMTESDFKLYETLKNTPDRELVFKNDFLAEFKAENPDLDEDDIESAAREQFDIEYPANKPKRIERAAVELRKEIFDKYKDAEDNYAYDKKYQAAKDPWVSFVKESLNDALSDEIIFMEGKDGEDDITIKVPLTKEEKSEIAKKILTPKRYSQFLNGTDEERKELSAILKERAQTLAIAKHTKSAVNNAIQRGIKIGTDRIKIGANNPFPLVDRDGATQGQESVKETIEQSHVKLKQHLDKYK